MDDFDTKDMIVIGGGINGAGIARDAAGRGLDVTLCEKTDFASATSSASTKLIHGGLRYLEHYEFGLVRKALVEREILLKSAPHIIRPLRFVLPYHRALRPALLIRAGLFFYDHMGGRKILPATNQVNFRKSPKGKPLKAQFHIGFEYSDCWVDDARLVVLTIMDAARKGAEILKGWRCVSAKRCDGKWSVLLEDNAGRGRTIHAKTLVNASGALAAELANKFEKPSGSRNQLRLVKGSHIILPKLYDGDHAYTFQEADGRIIFAIPYELNFTLVGTTDMAFQGNPDDVKISASEVDYLCSAISGYLRKSVSPEHAVWQYSGVRPLVDDGEEDASQVTRDYILDLNDWDGRAPLLSVFGGKITTYRKLAEQALHDLSRHLPQCGPAWTADAILPGGDIGGLCHDDYIAELQHEYPWAGRELLARYTRTHGSHATDILANCANEADLGKRFGQGLYEKELCYFKDHEWASAAEDVLWRRTKLGLVMSATEKEAIANWFNGN